MVVLEEIRELLKTFLGGNPKGGLFYSKSKLKCECSISDHMTYWEMTSIS